MYQGQHYFAQYDRLCHSTFTPQFFNKQKQIK